MNQLVQLPESAGVGPGKCVGVSIGTGIEAEEPGLCLQVLRALLDRADAQGVEEQVLTMSDFRRLLREVGLLAAGEKEADKEVVRARLEEVLVEHAYVFNQPGAPMADIASGLARIFEYGEATRDFLELALHANRCKLLRKLLNLCNDADENDAGEFFGRVLGYDAETMAEALRREIPFREHEPFSIGFCRSASMFYYLEFNRTAARIVRDRPTMEKMLGMFFRLSDKAKLRISDYDHQGTEVALMVQYVRQAMRTGRKGANVLLYGAPGTGKTELVRVLAEEVQARLVEVPSIDEDKDPLPHWKRLTALTAIQDILRSQASSLVLFDEVEDVFPVEYPLGRFSGGSKGGDRHKGWLVRLLEENVCPTLWVCNEVAHIDPAYLRRFDFVVELMSPKNEVRARMVDKAFAGIEIGKERLNSLKADKDLAPGHLERMGGVLRLLEPSCQSSAEAMLNTLERNTRKALSLPAQSVPFAKGLPYRMECINADVDMVELADSIADFPGVRICLYGPPGTGKSEWARQLAQRINRPLHVRRASDLLDKYVGESEKRIRRAFDDAAAENAVLLMDEADSLLYDRSRAQRSWEVSMVNEVLTCMESFDGVFVASTNLQKKLDEASARRFDFKVKLDYMTQKNIRIMFADLLAVLGVDAQALDEVSLCRLTALAPGDFANVLRQARLIAANRTAEKLAALLMQEQACRKGSSRHRIGFV